MQRTSPVVRSPGFTVPDVLGAGALIVAAAGMPGPAGATNHRIERCSMIPRHIRNVKRWTSAWN